MGRPQKTDRNRDLVLKRLEDPKYWNFRRLADYFRMDTRAVWEIFQRDLEVYATPEQVRAYKAR